MLRKKPALLLLSLCIFAVLPVSFGGSILTSGTTVPSGWELPCPGAAPGFACTQLPHFLRSSQGGATSSIQSPHHAQPALERRSGCRGACVGRAVSSLGSGNLKAECLRILEQRRGTHSVFTCLQLTEVKTCML